ncbi:serine/threonine kinase-like domain-containing protein STKLD1 [Paramacrobiotus metropolitanus]|uniref:serine/threonine kinase-like domain-containing protein STKLD1 n=1 Tax=Paramacrobiotus metropolitanus TaxID=2943436 RepID=UPI002445B44A|nr:serine/threonine kinase-like domain-containing protein STKLD1 [Paramacrobiotus metropolitanus]
MVELNHEHVAKYHQIKTTRTLGGVCIELMTDYYEGGNLASLLRRQWKENLVCDMSTVARCGGEIADGLTYLHAQQIVHGNLKPESVFIKQTEKYHNRLGSMIIGDLDDSSLWIFRCSRSLDITQQDIGMRYMSPEMLVNVSRFPKPCLELQTGRRTDIWSLGCILLDLACGIPRRQIQNVADIINAEDISVYCYLTLILNGYLPHVPQSIPETLASCIRKTLCFKSTERISAAELRDQLQSAALIPGCELASQNPLQSPRSSPKDCLLLVGPAGQ